MPEAGAEQETADSIYYQRWKEKSKESEKHFRNIFAAELAIAVVYLWQISVNSQWGWNYALGYVVVISVFIEYIGCLWIIRKFCC